MNTESRDNDSRETRRAIRQARDEIRPSPEFESRLAHALREAETHSHLPHASSWKRRWLLEAPLILPAALSVLVAAYVTLHSPSFDALNVAEHLLEVPVGGDASIALDLAMHHHGGDWTDIAVHAPRGVSVTTQEQPNRAPSCRGDRCRYDFSRKPTEAQQAMQIRVSGPGRYRMEIQHRSRQASVREVFLIHARR